MAGRRHKRNGSWIRSAMPFPEARTRKVAGSRTEVQQGCRREHRSEVKSWRSGAGAVREIWTELTPSPGRFELEGRRACGPATQLPSSLSSVAVGNLTCGRTQRSFEREFSYPTLPGTQTHLRLGRVTCSKGARLVLEYLSRAERKDASLAPTSGVEA